MAFWVPLMMAAAGAYMGAKKNEREREIEDADTKLQSELTRYSWVDGAMKGNPGAIRRAGSQIGDIGQGALSGAMFGSQFGGGGGDAKGVVAQNEAAGGQLYTGANQNNTWQQMLRQDNDKWKYLYGDDFGNTGKTFTS